MNIFEKLGREAGFIPIDIRPARSRPVSRSEPEALPRFGSDRRFSA
jgi:hypothetical protein